MNSLNGIDISFESDAFDELVHGTEAKDYGDLKLRTKRQDGVGMSPLLVAIGFTVHWCDNPINVQTVTTAKLFIAAARAIEARAQLEGIDLS